ncbi:acyl-CoA synthetase [Smaragdicoccus niigatensis]|uniref:acyl-CoA synthetase n=1 Tax=Smaragdicoccus niigatensis TaxID=359359 RepID=UPI000370B5DA|nr:acyl-CoA synthetase [Smaragdicoccus niigatensis]
MPGLDSVRSRLVDSAQNVRSKLTDAASTAADAAETVGERVAETATTVRTRAITAFETGLAVNKLRERGIFNPLRPDEGIRTLIDNRRYGPQAGVVLATARLYPNQAALTDEKGELTYRQLDEQSNQLARGLQSIGLKEGAHIALLARDHRGLLLSILAAGKGGYRLILMNTGFAKRQFAEVAERENVQAVLHDSEFIDLLSAMPSDIPHYLTWTDEGHQVEGMTTIDALANGQSKKALKPPKKSLGFVILTSGTTGTPKGAPRTKTSPMISAQLVDRIPFPRQKSVVIVSPIFHSTGMVSWAISALLGNKTVLVRRFNPENTLKLIQEHKAEMLVAVPTMLQRILDLGPDVIGKYDTSSLRIALVAGSAVSPELSRRMAATFGDVLYNMYGSTEAAVVAISTPQEQRIAPGTVGKPPVTCHVVLLDQNDEPIEGANKSGRIFAQNGGMFEGYTDGRHKAFVKGWMSTGDTGHFDENGLLFIDGRDDDMIVSGGENVFPGEVEDLLVERDDIIEAAVIGVDDRDFGKRLRAFVVPAKGSKKDVEEIKAYVKDNLARYKVPRDVIFIDELPRNATGKLLRTKLAEYEA